MPQPAARQDTDFGVMPEWDLNDLYPSPNAQVVADDIAKAAE